MSDGFQTGRVTAHDFIIGRIRRGRRGEENPFFIERKGEIYDPKNFLYLCETAFLLPTFLPLLLAFCIAPECPHSEQLYRSSLFPSSNFVYPCPPPPTPHIKLENLPMSKNFPLNTHLIFGVTSFPLSRLLASAVLGRLRRRRFAFPLLLFATGGGDGGGGNS